MRPSRRHRLPPLLALGGGGLLTRMTPALKLPPSSCRPWSRGLAALDSRRRFFARLRTLSMPAAMASSVARASRCARFLAMPGQGGWGGGLPDEAPRSSWWMTGRGLLVPGLVKAQLPAQPSPGEAEVLPHQCRCWLVSVAPFLPWHPGGRAKQLHTACVPSCPAQWHLFDRHVGGGRGGQVRQGMHVHRVGKAAARSAGIS